MIIGDFAPSFGQGLIVHNGFGAGKTSMVMLIRKQGAVFRPYTSVNETGYFRGIANVLNLSPSLKMAWLFSNKDIDAHLSSQNQDSTQSEIVSILKSGYHRTLNELGNKQNANQKILEFNYNGPTTGRPLASTIFPTFTACLLPKEMMHMSFIIFMEKQSPYQH